MPSHFQIGTIVFSFFVMFAISLRFEYPKQYQKFKDDLLLSKGEKMLRKLEQ